MIGGTEMKRMKFRKFFEYAFVIMICTLVLIPNSVYATTMNIVSEHKSNQIVAEDERIMKEYVTIRKDDIPYFDVDKAIKNGENKEVIEIGESFNKFSNDMNREEDSVATLRAATIPIWGNWCGPGYGSGQPIDLLDEGCRQHDNCYVHGGNNCNCNKRLINYINRNIGRMTGGQSIMARAVKLYFQGENFAKGC